MQNNYCRTYHTNKTFLQSCFSEVAGSVRVICVMGGFTAYKMPAVNNEDSPATPICDISIVHHMGLFVGLAFDNSVICASLS